MRAQLAHILRSSATIVGDPEILIIGSQAILGSFWETELPEQAWMSVEADVAFLDDPELLKADQVDGAIGEDSDFHRSTGTYGQGVSVDTAILPSGWQERVVGFSSSASHPAAAVCLDRHDLVVSKLAARREKDYAFAWALIEHYLVDIPTLRSRAALLPDRHGIPRQATADWLDYADRKLAKATPPR